MRKVVVFASLLALASIAPAMAQERPAQAQEVTGDAQGWKVALPSSPAFKIVSVTGSPDVPPEAVSAFRKVFEDAASQLPKGSQVLSIKVEIKTWKKSLVGSWVAGVEKWKAEPTITVTGADGQPVALLTTKTGATGMEAMNRPEGEVIASKAWVNLRKALSI